MPVFGSIFKWTEWNDYGETKSFMECTILRDIGDYKRGEYFESIFYNDEELTLKFYKTDEELEDDSPCMIKYLDIVD